MFVMWMRFTAMVVGGYLGNRRGWAVNRALLSFNAFKRNRQCGHCRSFFSFVLSLRYHTWLVHYMSAVTMDELDDVMTSTPSDWLELNESQVNFSAANTGTLNHAAAWTHKLYILQSNRFFFRFCFTNICWLILPPGFYNTTGIIHTATDGCVPGKRMFWWKQNCSL